jgi:hypothetical protein
MTNRERVTIWLRGLLAFAGVTNMAAGAWAELGPHGWYRTFPGLGHHWVSAVGPYDEHLVRDVGAALIAFGLLMVWTAVEPNTTLLRPGAVTVMVFGVLHLAYHVAAWEHMGTGDNIVNVAVLALVVIVPAALLWATSGPLKDEAPPADDSGSQVALASGRLPLRRN